MESKILDERQIKFLEEFQKIPFLKDNFYLTGGTALAAFYLKHRYSEDLDFFSEKEIDLLNLDTSLKKLQKTLKPNKVDFQQSYNRNLFFLSFGKHILKTEFTYFPFLRIYSKVSKKGISVDSLIDIAVNKLFTIYQRVAARDYIDLYFIIEREDFKINDLILKAKAKFDWNVDPIQLGAQFVKSGEAEDFPRMIEKIKTAVWRKFFIDEAKKLKRKII